MAEKVVEEVRVLKRGGGAAATFAFFAMILSVVALVLASQANNKATEALQTANHARDQVHTLNAKVDDALGTLNNASSGSGSGENTTQPVPGGSNATPNGNGQ
jgi:predicted PurR-regulated permease PerM